MILTTVEGLKPGVPTLVVPRRRLVKVFHRTVHARPHVQVEQKCASDLLVVDAVKCAPVRLR